jgi:acyl transferase domain-containing protein
VRVTSNQNEGHLAIGCVNSAVNVTVSGSEAHIDALKSILDAEGIFCQKLKVSVAYHSPYMNEIAGRYGELLKDLCSGSTSESSMMVSSVNGSIIQPEELSRGDYWVRNMVSTVRFSDALSRLFSQSPKSTRRKLGDHGTGIVTHDLLEIGAHSALKNPIKEFLNRTGMSDAITYHSMLIRDRSAVDTSLAAAGHLYCLGYHVNVSQINSCNPKLNTRPMVVTDLPEYPFNHSQIYWLEGRMSKGFRFRNFLGIFFLGPRRRTGTHSKLDGTTRSSIPRIPG